MISRRIPPVQGLRRCSSAAAALLLALSLAPLAAQAKAELPPSSQPTDEAAFAEALGLKSVRLATAPGLELWCEDKAVMSALQKPVLAAWEEARRILPEPAPDPALPYRIVVLKDEEAVRAYRPLYEAECARAGVPLPPASFYEGAARTGSARWAYPPLCLMRSGKLSKQVVLSRAVHDLGALRIGLAASEQGFGVPEFLIEGFAGMLVRRAVKKPAALVSHEGAAVSETIHGYGVFAGIGAAMNDSSNHPGNWATSMRTAAKAWRKQDEIGAEERIDALLKRPKASFARADYAYAWAVSEFLLEDRYGYGEAAVAAAADRKWKPGEPLEANRRALLLPILGTLRHPNYRMAEPAVRAGLLLSFLEKKGGEDAAALHAAFQHWLETGMPKK